MEFIFVLIAILVYKLSRFTIDKMNPNHVHIDLIRLKFDFENNEKDA